ncbi:phosphatidate cytidylyltransferase [Halioxenophilus aromaticivorans]|uniref:Phosphatidate cytidylyltransferase n=1 Tax=Halioxenophilus aromaticivorans TaxID=1306992 RepID=A0AAV3TYR0_9ALTE
MLKQRVISACIMMLVFLLVLLVLPPIAFIAFVSLGMAIGAWEWSNLAGLGSRAKRYAYLALVLFATVLCGWYIDIDADFVPQNMANLQALFWVSLIWWGIALLWVQGYPSSSVLWGSIPARLLMGMLVLVPAWVGLFFIRAQEHGSWLVLLLVLAVAAADTGAYFAGKRFGRRRLAASVSPGKSWEGFAGGLMASIALAVVVGQFWAPDERLWILLLVAPTALVSVLGDLLESMVKRHRGVKDSGLILPGHGGVLDRVDGMTAAVPVFAFTLLVTGMHTSAAIG